MDEEYKQTEETYKFFLPDNQDELNQFQKSSNFQMALFDIQDKCQNVWKYEEDPSDARIALAQEISGIIADSGALDD